MLLDTKLASGSHDINPRSRVPVSIYHCNWHMENRRYLDLRLDTFIYIRLHASGFTWFDSTYLDWCRRHSVEVKSTSLGREGRVFGEIDTKFLWEVLEAGLHGQLGGFDLCPYVFS